MELGQYFVWNSSFQKVKSLNLGKHKKKVPRNKFEQLFERTIFSEDQ